MKFIDLVAEKREGTGKSVCKNLRKDGKIPAVVYGKNNESFAVAVNRREFEKSLRENSSKVTLVNLLVDGQKYMAMLKDYQKDFYKGVFSHLDFLTIEENQEIDVNIPVEIVGEDACIGIKRDGGMLQTVRRALDVRCSVQNIPEVIKVDISELEGGDSIHIEDVELGEGVQVFTEVNFTIATIVAPSGGSDEAEEAEESEEASEE